MRYGQTSPAKRPSRKEKVNDFFQGVDFTCWIDRHFRSAGSWDGASHAGGNTFTEML
jgi:hypothetical protein